MNDLYLAMVKEVKNRIEKSEDYMSVVRFDSVEQTTKSGAIKG